MKNKLQSITLFIAILALLLSTTNYSDNRSQDSILFKTVDQVATLTKMNRDSLEMIGTIQGIVIEYMNGKLKSK